MAASSVPCRSEDHIRRVSGTLLHELQPAADGKIIVKPLLFAVLLTPRQARSYTVDNTSQAPPRNVYMIARISSIDTTEPQVELYVDPWRMFLDNKLDFKPPGSFEVRVWA